jgi:hypothetical protein
MVLRVHLGIPETHKLDPVNKDSSPTTRQSSPMATHCKLPIPQFIYPKRMEGWVNLSALGSNTGPTVWWAQQAADQLLELTRKYIEHTVLTGRQRSDASFVTMTACCIIWSCAVSTSHVTVQVFVMTPIKLLPDTIINQYWQVSPDTGISLMLIPCLLST